MSINTQSAELPLTAGHHVPRAILPSSRRLRATVARLAVGAVALTLTVTSMAYVDSHGDGAAAQRTRDEAAHVQRDRIALNGSSASGVADRPFDEQGFPISPKD